MTRMNPWRGSCAQSAWPRQVSCLLLALASLDWSTVRAMTPAEAELARSPLPHETLSHSGQQVKVHWVRYLGYVEGPAGHEALLEDLKADVQTCINAAQLAGRATNPPKVWPDYVHSLRTDSYEAGNRTIMYGTSLMYTINHSDCSLIENRAETASLSSSLGFCEMDLMRKEAHGYCDPSAHGRATVAAHFGPATSHPAGQRQSSTPAMQAAVAAWEKAKKQYGPIKTGERKEVLGIQCEVETSALGTTNCVAIVNSLGEPGTTMALPLELKMPGSYSAAIKANLNASVSGAVFAPYVVGGFQITNGTRRK